MAPSSVVVEGPFLLAKGSSSVTSLPQRGREGDDENLFKSASKIGDGTVFREGANLWDILYLDSFINGKLVF